MNKKWWIDRDIFEDSYSCKNYMGYQCKLLEPSGHVVGHLKALNVKSTKFLVCFHSTSSSLLLFHLKSIWKTWLLNFNFQVFVSPQIHFQCQIYNVTIVSSFFLIVFELFLNKRVNVWSSLLYRQLLDSILSKSKVVFAKNGASLKL